LLFIPEDNEHNLYKTTASFSLPLYRKIVDFCQQSSFVYIEICGYVWYYYLVKGKFSILEAFKCVQPCGFSIIIEFAKIYFYRFQFSNTELSLLCKITQGE